MRELLWFSGLLLVFALLSVVVAVPPERGLAWGAAVVGIGAVFGVPTGIYYHVLLYRALNPTQQLPPRWIWSPIQYNDRVPKPERDRVWFYCRMGAIGLGIMVLGLVMMGSAVILGLVRLQQG